jgi:hypothetical protein
MPLKDASLCPCIFHEDSTFPLLMRLDGEHGFGGGMFHEDSTFPLLMRVNGGDGLGDDVEELTCSILPTCGSTKHSL